MSQGRIVPLVGPLLVLYLTLEVVGSSGTFAPEALGTCAFALGLSAMPIWVLRRRGERAGVRRVAMLGVASGVALVRFARPEMPSLYLDLAFAIALPAIGGLTAHLALDAPDEPPGLRRRRPWVVAFTTLGVASAISASLAAVPHEWIGGVLVPARWLLAAPGFLFFGWAVALALRLARRRLGSTPEALAAGGSAHLGTWAAMASAGAAVGLVLSGTFPATAIAVSGLLTLSAVSLLAGHVAMLGGRRQVHAGRNTRMVIAASLSIAAVGGTFACLAEQVPREPVPFAVVIAVAVGSTALLHHLLRRAVDRLLAPYGGRLVRGAELALRAAVGATSLGELGAAVLPHLRRAADTVDAEPLIISLDPPRAVRIDAASIAHVEEREIGPALRARLAASPRDVIVAAPLAGQVVRRADLRPLVDALESFDALCVVPLSVDLELEGVLVVARGHRRGGLTLEEIDALERLGRHLSAQVAMLGANERARLRTRDAVIERDRLTEELEATTEELSRLRVDTRILKAGGAAERYRQPVIAYSPAMRKLMRRVGEVGPLDAPALLVGEEGSELDRIAHCIHAASGRGQGPFVVADCAAVRPERADASLFGESDAAQPGWLRLAEGGTCLLRDVPALSLDAQAKLAEALATRRAVLADGAGSYPVDARVVATSRVPLGALVAAGAFDAELHRRLEPLVLEVPPLRERREDLPSLILLALDRTCRTAGRPVMGADPDALEALVLHTWPGNLRELDSVIDRAADRATGKNIGRVDLPPFAPSPGTPDPFSGTYVEVEKRLLETAMKRSDGNKSEAARLLGLKRTTFVDKLKRHGLHGADKRIKAGNVA